jgi:hypothetical protein
MGSPADAFRVVRSPSAFVGAPAPGRSRFRTGLDLMPLRSWVVRALPAAGRIVLSWPSSQRTR